MDWPLRAVESGLHGSCRAVPLRQEGQVQIDTIVISNSTSTTPAIFRKYSAELDNTTSTTSTQAMITTATPPATPQRPPPASSVGAPRRNVAGQLLKRQGLVRNGGDVQMLDTPGSRTVTG